MAQKAKSTTAKKAKAAPVDRKMTNQIAETRTPSRDVDSEGLLNTYGAPGTRLIAGFLHEEYNENLTGRNAAIVYERMRKSDAMVNATLMAMELPIRSARWYVEPAKNEDGETEDTDREIAKFVEKALFEKMDIVFDDFLREALTMLAFGFSVFEIIWESDGQNIWVKNLASRKQSTIYKWEQMDGTAGVSQLLTAPKVGDPNMGANTVSMPAEKIIIFTYRREGNNYEGTSVLRSAYKHWTIKDRLYSFDTIRHERQSVGVPVIYLPDNSSEADKEEALTIVENIRTTEQTGMVIPGSKDQGWLFEFADMHASDSTNLFESIGHHNREIAKNILAQFLELGAASGSGSRALSEDQSDLFLLGLKAVARQIADTINRYLIPRLVDFNYDGVENYPHITFETIGGINVDKFAAAVASLSASGNITPDSDTEAHIRNVIGLPPKMKDDPNAPVKPEASKEPTQTPQDAKKEEMTPETPTEPVKPAETKKMAEHEHETCGVYDEEFMKVSALFNNRFITELQNQARGPEDIAKLRAKGFRFNEYEDTAPRPLTFAERKVNFKSL